MVTCHLKCRVVNLCTILILNDFIIKIFKTSQLKNSSAVTRYPMLADGRKCIIL